MQIVIVRIPFPTNIYTSLIPFFPFTLHHKRISKKKKKKTTLCIMKLPFFNHPIRSIYDDSNLPTLQQLSLDDNITSSLPNNGNNSTNVVNGNFPRGRKGKIVMDWVGIAFIFALVFLFYLIFDSPVQLFRLNDVDLSYPYYQTGVSSILAGTLSILVPIATVFFFNLFFLWEKWDLYAGLFGTVFAYASSLLITSTLWYFVGGLRPHFLSVCKIDPSLINPSRLYYTSDMCDQDTFTQDTLHAFPSGHASTAFAGCVFASSYLAAHLRLYRNGNAFKAFIVALPLLCAVWLASSRIADRHHSPFQVLVGSLIGILAALIAYKMAYIHGFWFGYGKYAYLPYAKYRTIP